MSMNYILKHFNLRAFFCLVFFVSINGNMQLVGDL